MSHLMVRVTEFEIVGDYVIRIAFDDETEQTINFEPVLHGYYLGPLRDLDLFNKVRLDSDFHTLIWPNDADFDPATLYDWNRGAGEELSKRALERWGAQVLLEKLADEALAEHRAGKTQPMTFNDEGRIVPG